jgi:hypothetical protein
VTGGPAAAATCWLCSLIEIIPCLKKTVLVSRPASPGSVDTTTSSKCPFELSWSTTLDKRAFSLVPRCCFPSIVVTMKSVNLTSWAFWLVFLLLIALLLDILWLFVVYPGDILG